MSFDWAIELAKELIDDNGQEVTWRVNREVAPFDPSRPWERDPAAPIEHTVRIVFLPQSRENRELIRAMRGSEVPTGRVMGLMAAGPFEPTLKDTVVRDGKTLAIECIDVLAPNGPPILYTLEFKA